MRFESFSIQAGIDGSGVPTDMVSVNSTVKLSFRNTAAFFGLHVSSTPVDLFYSQLALATGNVSLRRSSSPAPVNSSSLIPRGILPCADRQLLPAEEEPENSHRGGEGREDPSLRQHSGERRRRRRRPQTTTGSGNPKVYGEVQGLRAGEAGETQVLRTCELLGGAGPDEAERRHLPQELLSLRLRSAALPWMRRH